MWEITSSSSFDSLGLLCKNSAGWGRKRVWVPLSLHKDASAQNKTINGTLGLPWLVCFLLDGAWEHNFFLVFFSVSVVAPLICLGKSLCLPNIDLSRKSKWGALGDVCVYVGGCWRASWELTLASLQSSRWKGWRVSGAVNLGDLNHLQEGICFAAQLGVKKWRQLERPYSDLSAVPIYASGAVNLLLVFPLWWARQLGGRLCSPCLFRWLFQKVEHWSRRRTKFKKVLGASWALIGCIWGIQIRWRNRANQGRAVYLNVGEGGKDFPPCVCNKLLEVNN